MKLERGFSLVEEGSRDGVLDAISIERGPGQSIWAAMGLRRLDSSFDTATDVDEWAYICCSLSSLTVSSDYSKMQ